MVNILIGVSGSGKTTIGKLLSNSIQKPFFDADDYHSPKNILKMKNGMALTDAERRPWLKRLNQLISEWNNKKGAVLACSALKEKHRQIIADGNNVSFIFLEGNQELISKRIATRKGHFFPIELLQNQYDILEIPTYGIRVEVDRSPEDICKEIYTAIKADHAKDN